jgi:hypothetical protein
MLINGNVEVSLLENGHSGSAAGRTLPPVSGHYRPELVTPTDQTECAANSEFTGQENPQMQPAATQLAPNVVNVQDLDVVNVDGANDVT